MNAPKYVDPAHVATVASYPTSPNSKGILTTTPQPAYALGPPRGITNPGNPTAIHVLAETPPNLRASLFRG
jgi:hypothetical protein